MIVRLRGVSAEKNVAIVMHGGYLDSRATQQFVGVSARRAPHGIEDYPQICLANDVEIDSLTQALQVGRLGIDRVVRCRRVGATFGSGGTIPGDDFGFDFLRDFRQGRASVGSRKLDSVIFGRIVGGGEINDPIRLVVDYGVRKGRRGGGFGDHQRRDSVSGQDFRGHRAERLTQKAWIASHDHARPLRLLRSYVSGDATHGAPHVGEGEVFGHHCPPTRCAKLDLR